MKWLLHFTLRSPLPPPERNVPASQGASKRWDGARAGHKCWAPTPLRKPHKYIKIVAYLGVWISESIDHLYTPLGTISNYSAIADLHTLQITTASIKPFFSLLCLHQPFPDNGFNSGDSSASSAQVLFSQPSCRTLVSCQLNYTAISS
jgi:hypothetical protein